MTGLATALVSTKYGCCCTTNLLPGKVAETWYDCAVPENATTFDIYYEYSLCVLSQGTTLPDQYQAASVVGYIEKLVIYLTWLN